MAAIAIKVLASEDRVWVRSFIADYRSGNCVPHGRDSRVASPESMTATAVERRRYEARITGRAEGSV